MINKLNQNRRIAMRFDETLCSFASFIGFAAIRKAHIVFRGDVFFSSNQGLDQGAEEPFAPFSEVMDELEKAQIAWQFFL
jgi:hypothetical protein